MATNPPIVIGPFSNVPAPGSGVKSDWAQQISHHVTERVAGGLVARPAYVTADQSVVAEVDLTGLTVTFSPVVGHWYEAVFLACLIQGGAAGNQNLYVNLAGSQFPVLTAGAVPANQIVTYSGSLVFAGGAVGSLPAIAPGAGRVVKMRGSGAGFVLKNSYTGGMFSVRDLGTTVAAP